MKKLCFHIQKGGVGKTSISSTIASSLARQGKKTVLVDCDPQGNASSWYCKEAVEYDIADVLARRAPLSQAVRALSPNLSIIPVVAIGGSLKEWSETKLTVNPKAFEFLMTDLEALGFEYAVFDCSPSFSQLERAVIAEVDEVVNPLSPEFFSIDGIEIFIAELRKIEDAYRRTIKNDKIALNLLNKSYSRHREFKRVLEKLNYQIFIIPQDAKIAECQIAHQSLYDFAPQAKSIPGFEALAKALL
ncbi:ParA family protein [Breznakiellaceae bacterium SP9]